MSTEQPPLSKPPPDYDVIAHTLEIFDSFVDASVQPRTIRAFRAFALATQYWIGYYTGLNGETPSPEMIQERALETWETFLLEAEQVELRILMHAPSESRPVLEEQRPGPPELDP